MQRAIKQTIKTNKPYFLTLTVTDWVDVFSRKNHRDAIIDSMRYCQEHKGLVVFAYVIIHKNPVRSGPVNESQHWIYSSASNYYGTESILEIECLSQPLKTV